MRKHLVDQRYVEIRQEEKSTRELIKDLVSTKDKEGDDNRFFVCDIGDVIEKFQYWFKIMPRVKPFYAVKCNSDAALLKILADMGSSFDCASENEIKTVLQLGVPPSRIIYAHPIKPASTLIYAKWHDVSLMTFDSISELYKVKATYPSARLVLRIHVEGDFEAIYNFGRKFGCRPTDAFSILKVAKKLDLDVVGVSFHVGSDIKDPKAYLAAIQQSKDVFDIARTIGYNMKVLDIGGGYPGGEDCSGLLTEIAKVVNEALNELFPPEEDLEIIAEPGRYMSNTAYALVVHVIGKRLHPKTEHGSGNGFLEASRKDQTNCDENDVTYFVNDSAYSNFLFGRLVEPGSVLYIPKSVESKEDEVYYNSTVYGFTLAVKDCLNMSAKLPMLEIGDWIYYENMGAYTISSATSFNGIPDPEMLYFCRKDLWYSVYGDSKPRED